MESHAMAANTFPPQAAVRSSIDRRAQRIQATWSADERRRRAHDGQRRARALISMISAVIDRGDREPAIWAVGAPGIDDVCRIPV
jgi:hypothetical protein